MLRSLVLPGKATARVGLAVNAVKPEGMVVVRPRSSGLVWDVDQLVVSHSSDLGVELLRWAVTWLGQWGKPLWLVADGAYAKAGFLRPLKGLGVTVVSRLRKDAALW